MKTKLLNYFCLFLMISISTWLQAQSPQLERWCIPPNQVAFATGTPVTSSLPSSTAAGGYLNSVSFPNEISIASNSMHDANGNLLFFVTQDSYDGYHLKVFDKNGAPIKDVNGNDDLKFDYHWSDNTGPHLNPGYIFNSWAEEISIVPVPGNCNQYYIIAGFLDEHNISTAIAYEPVYAKLDLSLSTNGALLAASSTSNLFDLTNLPGMPAGAFQPYAPLHKYRFGIATTPFRPEAVNQSNFLYVYSEYSNTIAYGFFKYKIDASGISFVSCEHPTLSPPAGVHNNYYSEMEIVRLPSGNYRMAKVREDNNIYYCDLDYANGSIIAGTERMITLALGKSLEGLEFSPDGNYLYYTYHGTLNKIGYLGNLSAGGTPVPTDYMSFDAGFAEIGYDGRIYFSIAPGDHLICKTVPNLPGSGFWNMSAATLAPDYTGSYSKLLPDQMDGQIYYAASPSISGNNYACSSSPEVYTLGGAYDPSIYYTWTITGGTPSTYTGTSQTLAITWTASGGTISVQAGCSPAITFTVNPCCQVSVPGKTTIYLNNVTETAPVTYSGTSSVYVINGSYTINSSPVTFDNCAVYLAANVPVTINSGGYLKIQNGSVWQAGCGAMWNGIVENTGSNLLIDNSTLRDAKLAIDSKNGAPFTMSNNAKLNANYRGVLIEAFGSTLHPAIIKNSTISCLNTSGVPANCLIAPYAAQKSLCGIEINDNMQVNIGLDVAGQTNTFNNLWKG
ncbi:MAG: hypothetical protein ACJ76F_00750, partial [Bacteroidia bacterium]